MISTLKALGLAWDIKLAKLRQPLPADDAHDAPVVPTIDEAVA